MGRVIEREGLRVWVWSEDHVPPHVHVASADWEITVSIGDAAVLDRIKWGRPTARAVRSAIALVTEHLDAANAEWRRCHG